MNNESILNQELDSVCKEIFASYNSIGKGNSRTSLPSRKGVANMVRCMESLIFPGFQHNADLKMDDARQKIYRLSLLMAHEIECNLEHNRSLGQLLMEEKNNAAHSMAIKILGQLPQIRAQLMGDVEALLKGDPAAKSRDEVILSYPGLEAITVYRLAHEFYIRGLNLISRMMSERVHRNTGIDIHPGAAIGEEFFIDHGTGVVIGETAVIGSRVKLYQGVTIGALSVDKELANRKRHPTIEDDVTIYAGATILGGKTVVGKGAIVGGNVWLTSSVPAFSMVHNRPADYRIINRYNEGSASLNENWSI